MFNFWSLRVNLLTSVLIQTPLDCTGVRGQEGCVCVRALKKSLHSGHLTQCLACDQCLARAYWGNAFAEKCIWMNLYLAKLGIHTEHSVSCSHLLLGCWLSPKSLVPPGLQPSFLEDHHLWGSSADWPTWCSRKEKHRKPLTCNLVTVPAQPILSHPPLSSFLSFCLWRWQKTKLQLWLDIFLCLKKLGKNHGNSDSGPLTLCRALW